MQINLKIDSKKLLDILHGISADIYCEHEHNILKILECVSKENTRNIYAELFHRQYVNLWYTTPKGELTNKLIMMNHNPSENIWAIWVKISRLQYRILSRCYPTQ